MRRFEDRRRFGPSEAEWLRAARSSAGFRAAVAANLIFETTSAAQLGKWGPGFSEGVDRMRRLVCEYYEGFSFGKFVRSYSRLQGTVTDLLIGDLFDDKVDRVWQPMESLYPPGKTPIAPWFAGASAADADGRANELVLPDGRRP